MLQYSIRRSPNEIWRRIDPYTILYYTCHGSRVEEALDRLLAARAGDAGGAEVALGDNRTVGEGDLEGTDALLLRH